MLNSTSTTLTHRFLHTHLSSRKPQIHPISANEHHTNINMCSYTHSYPSGLDEAFRNISSISLECKWKQTTHTLTNESSCQSSHWLSFTIKCIQVFLVTCLQNIIVLDLEQVCTHMHFYSHSNESRLFCSVWPELVISIMHTQTLTICNPFDDLNFFIIHENNAFC